MSAKGDVEDGKDNTTLIDLSLEKEGNLSDQQVNQSLNICTQEVASCSVDAGNQPQQVDQSLNICTQEVASCTVDAGNQSQQVNQPLGSDKLIKVGSTDLLGQSKEGSVDSTSVKNQSGQVNQSVTTGELTREKSVENLQQNSDQSDEACKLESEVEQIENSENKKRSSENALSSEGLTSVSKEQTSEQQIVEESVSKEQTSEQHIAEEFSKQDKNKDKSVEIVEDSQNDLTGEIESTQSTDCEKDKHVEKEATDLESKELGLPEDKSDIIMETSNSSGEGVPEPEQMSELSIVSIESRANMSANEEMKETNKDKKSKDEILASEELNNGKGSEVNVPASEKLNSDKDSKIKVPVSEELSSDKESKIKVPSSEELKNDEISKADVATTEELKSDDESDLIIDLGDGKKPDSYLETNGSSNSETRKQVQMSKSLGLENSAKNIDMKTNSITQTEKQIVSEDVNENDEMATSFEKLEKSLREFRESLSKGNGDEADDKEESSVKSDNNNIQNDNQQEKSVEKELEEEMECLLKEYQESTNKAFSLKSIDSVDSISSNEESVKVNASYNDNPSSDEADKSNLKENQKDTKLSAETTGKESNSKDRSKNVELVENTGSKTDSSDGSIKSKQKPKLYDSNELWSKMGMNRCKMCNFTTDDESLFRQHMCSKKPKKDIVLTFKEDKYNCESCSMSFLSRKNFEEHLGYHLLSHPFICLECKTTFQKNADLEVHVKNKHPNETVRCGLRAHKKIGEIIDSLRQCGNYRLAGRTIDSKTLASILPSKEKQILPKNKVEDRVKFNQQDDVNRPHSSTDGNLDSSESVVIYLSDSPTSVSNVVPGNVSSAMGTSYFGSTSNTNAPITMPTGQQAVSNLVASNKPQVQNTVKVPISRTPLKVPTYTAAVTVKTTVPQVKNVSSYPPSYSTPVLLIPVTMPTNMMNPVLPQSPGASVNLPQRMVTTTNMMNPVLPQSPGASVNLPQRMVTTTNMMNPVLPQSPGASVNLPQRMVTTTNMINPGLPQSPGASVNLPQRMVTTTNTYLTSTPVQQRTSVGLNSVAGAPARGTLSVINRQSVPVPSTTARFQGGQFINIGHAVQQSGVVNPSLIDNSQGTRLIILPEGMSSVQPISNQMLGMDNVVGSVAGPQSVLNSTAVPVVGQKNVTKSSQPLTTITTSAPPPSYAEAILNQQSQLTAGNWISILKQPANVVQNNTSVKSPQHTLNTFNTSSTSSLQLPTSVSQTVTNSAKELTMPNVAPNKVMVKTLNKPILPKLNPNDNNSGILATSMIITGERKDGGGNKLFFRKSGGRFTCDFCCNYYDSEEKFREHVWKHFHEMQHICKTCSNRSYNFSSKCALVERVLTGLHCAATAKNSKIAEKKLNQAKEMETFVILSDDEEEEPKEKLDNNIKSSVTENKDQSLTENSVTKITENKDQSLTENSVTEITENKDQPDSEKEKKDEKLTEDNDESRYDKEEANDSGLQLKITSIVSLHRSKKSDDVGVQETEKKESDNEELNENVQQSEKSGEETRKKNLENVAGNIFEKFTEEIRAVHGSTKNKIVSSAQNPSDSLSKTVTSEPSESVADTATLGSDSKTSGNENKNEAALKEMNKQSNASSLKPLPGYEFGGSFYVCGFRECSFRCLTSPEFRDHLVNFHSSATEFTCAHCGHKSYTEECYLRHMFVHSNAKSFVLFLCKCGACKFGTNLINLFKEHLNQTHPSEESYKCSSCNENFRGIQELVDHLQSNLLKFVQCPYCSVKDRNRRFILTHISQTHPGKVKQITVTSQLICHERESNAYVAPDPKQMEGSSNLNVIENNSNQDIVVKQEPVETLQETVRNVNVFQLAIPQKQARRTSEDSVKSDTKSGNNGVSLMKCPKCSYIVNGKGFLKKHLKVHEKVASKQRPFMCPYCPGESDIQSKFISHVGLHCGNQKSNGIFKIQIYHCVHCTFQSNLLGKVFAHGERAHVNFSKESDYTTSTLKIKSRSFMCETCVFFTRNKADYDKHVDMHKNGERANSVNTSNLVDTVKDAQPVESGTNNSPLNIQNDINTGNESRRFCCKECSKTFKRLPHLKQHLSVHIKNEAYQLTYFRCSYCGFSSTSKLCISRHTEERHAGKLIRIKRRVESVSSTKAESQAQPDSLSDPPKVSIDTYHCDCCAFSCSNKDDLIRHTKLHFVTISSVNNATTPKMDKPPKKPYEGPTEPFIIPAGNVYKTPVTCSKCKFSTKLRLELLRHVKMHPMLIPESEQSPRKEANPQDKATKLLVKTTFLKRRLSSSPEFKPGPHKKKKIEQLDSSSGEDYDDYNDEIDIDDFDKNDDEKLDEKTEEVSKKSQNNKSQLSRKMEISKGSLYFLGGDLLHNKLKPCYSQEGGNGEYTCLYCGSELHEKYPLHKHLLQHMDVSFYKCAYCEFGSLEVTPIVIHIQRQHRKPVKHIQQPLNEVESKINKAIHEMKAQHYLGIPSKTPVNPVVEETTNIKMEMPDIEPEVEDINQLEPELNDELSSVIQSPSKSFKSPRGSSSVDSQDSSPSKLTKLASGVKNTGPLIKCKICSYTSSSKHLMNRHSIIHSKFKRYGCSYCSYRTNLKQNASKHVINVHQGEKVCLVTYDNSDTPMFQSTNKSSTDAGSHESKKDSEFYGDNDLPDLGPVPKEEITKPALTFWSKFKCMLCLKKFKSKWAIDQHFRSAECGKIPMFGCSMCKFKNPNNETVVDHIKLKHPLSQSAKVLKRGRSAKFRIFKIPVKVKQPKSEQNRHHSVKSDVASPKNIGSSVSHIKVQRTRERNALIKKVGNLYKCKVCPYRGQRSNVSRHLSTHSQLIKYSCQFCEYKSNWNFNMKRHVLKYHSDKTFDPRTWDKPGSSTEDTSSPETKHLVKQKTSMLDSSNQTSAKNIEIKKEPGEKNIKAKIKKIESDVQTGSVATEQGLEGSLVLLGKGKPVAVTCPSCSHLSASRTLFQDHFDKCHKNMFLACTKCPYKTKLMKNLIKHMIRIHQCRNMQFEIHRKKLRNKDVQFQCPKCHHQAKKPNMRAHLYYHLDYRPINCGHCCYRTRKQMIAKKHILSNHPGLPLKIIVKQDKAIEAEINQMLSSLKVADNDLQQHTDVILWKKRPLMSCQYENCDFKCVKKKTMSMHVSVVHMDEDQHSEKDFQSPDVPEKLLNNDKNEEFPPPSDDIFSPKKNYIAEYSSKLHKEVYRCIHCNYVATVMKSIVSHYYLHVPHIFKCPYCSFRNYPRSRIIQHIAISHKGKPLHVIDLRSNQTLEPKTSQTSSPGIRITSNSPKKKTTTPPKKTKNEKKIVPAESYSDIFTSEGSSDEDTTSPSAKKGITYKETGKICYNCNFCRYTSSVFYHYRQHLATHGGFKWQSSGTIIESRLKCGMCAFLAINDEEFKVHMENHLNTRPYICPYCDYTAFSTSSVKKHVVNKHPNKPVEALKNDQSGDLVVLEGGPTKSIKIVEMDPKVKLYDIFSMESEDFEQLLTDADVSVIDLQYIPDEKFDLVSKTLGFSTSDIQELESSSVENSSFEDSKNSIDDEGDDEDQLLDMTPTGTANTECESDDNKLNDSINSTESMEYEILDEVTDSVDQENKISETNPDDQDNGLEDISDIEDETKDYSVVLDKEGNAKEKEDDKQTIDIQSSESSKMVVNVT